MSGSKVYGASDDLIEFEGECEDEVEFICRRDEPLCLIAFSDGTVLTATYGKGDEGIWSFAVLSKGSLYDRIEVCTDEDADPHSDVVFFRPGALRAWVGLYREAVR